MSVAPASSTLAMFGWSISASACRSASNRAMTCLVSMPSLMTLSATRRRTGSSCSAILHHAAAALADLLQQLVTADHRRPGCSVTMLTVAPVLGLLVESLPRSRALAARLGLLASRAASPGTRPARKAAPFRRRRTSRACGTPLRFAFRPMILTTHFQVRLSRLAQVAVRTGEASVHGSPHLLMRSLAAQTRITFEGKSDPDPARRACNSREQPGAR